MFTAQEVLEVVHKSLHPTNRYYASQRLGREATVEESVQHYLMYAPPLIHVEVYTVHPLTGEDDAPLFVG